jgi:hypothetical protein
LDPRFRDAPLGLLDEWREVDAVEDPPQEWFHRQALGAGMVYAASVVSVEWLVLMG